MFIPMSSSTLKRPPSSSSQKASTVAAELSEAARLGRFSTAKNLLSQRTASKAINYADEASGRTSLHHACAVGHLRIARLLVESGGEPSVNQPDKIGDYPLHLATRGSYIRVVKFLVEEAHASLDVKNSFQETVLSIAAEQQLFQILEYFVSIRDRWGPNLKISAAKIHTVAVASRSHRVALLLAPTDNTENGDKSASQKHPHNNNLLSDHCVSPRSKDQILQSSLTKSQKRAEKAKKAPDDEAMEISSRRNQDCNAHHQGEEKEDDDDDEHVFQEPMPIARIRQDLLAEGFNPEDVETTRNEFFSNRLSVIQYKLL